MAVSPTNIRDPSYFHGVYLASDPTLVDGQPAYFRFTSDNKLMVDTELTIDNITISNIKVFSTTGTVGGAGYGLIDSEGHLQAHVFSTTGTTDGANYAWLFTNSQDLSAVSEKWQGIGGYNANTDKFLAFPIVLDSGTMPPTPAGIPIMGEYRLVQTTYIDGAATILQSDINGNLRTVSTADIPISLVGGSGSVAVAGTAVALGSSLTTKSIYIRARSGNTNNIYVGDSNVDKDTNKQVSLTANDSITLDISNRATIYIDADTAGDGWDYLAMS